MTDGTWNRKGLFEFPEDAQDLIDLFLSPAIRQARREVHNQIENSNLNPLAQKVGKAVVDIQAITMQGRMDRQQRQQLSGTKVLKR